MSGVLRSAAAHPYRRLAPETFVPELALLRRLLSGGTGEKAEIWDTESGNGSYDYFSKNLRGDGHKAAGRNCQAVLACREALTVWVLGLPVAVWYDLRDDGGDPRNPEHNYGLLDLHRAEKPAIIAFRTLTRLSADHTIAGMIPYVPDGAHAMRLNGNGDKVYAAWSHQPDSRIAVRFNGEGLASATNLLGEPLKMKESGHKDVEITPLWRPRARFISNIGRDKFCILSNWNTGSQN
jgi:hypothetical protein